MKDTKESSVHCTSGMGYFQAVFVLLSLRISYRQDIMTHPHSSVWSSTRVNSQTRPFAFLEMTFYKALTIGRSPKKDFYLKSVGLESMYSVNQAFNINILLYIIILQHCSDIYRTLIIITMLTSRTGCTGCVVRWGNPIISHDLYKNNAVM